MSADTVKRALAVEVRKQGKPDFARVYQYLIFEGRMFFRSITTENPRKHWKVIDAANVTHDDGQFLREIETMERRGYELTTEPFLVEATEAEFAASDAQPHRNIVLRADRVRSDRALPNPVLPV